jgi:hypothetical protein
MHITMVKKTLADGSDCRKCADASEYLQSRGLWDRVNDVIWADENDVDSPGMRLAARFGVDHAPFFIVRDDSAESVYTSVLHLVRERFGQTVTAADEARTIDVEEIGGI